MKKIFLATAIYAILAALPAQAEMYVGAGVGEARSDARHTSAKVFGGFQLDPTWGLELAYTDLHRYRNANVEARSLALVGTKPFAANWALLGKLGASSNRSHFSGSHNHTDLLVGLGIAYNFSKTVGLRLEYEDFGKLSKTDIGNDSRGTNLGLSMRFGF